ncbi:serine hydrolase domain-containing protein [Streptomyces flavofungini]|uniref:serine hydrolase domain-containing protein n=1 Tax=Streptomyces flavofungini TaxID=68200 RepID=UPI0025AF38E6|nr:serine hydrolase domain-containing protein [Streptomyces flavofungini]WJV45391.1 serine hydrolase domain-containing protein [Streptomyces flavofungini]
MNLRRRLTAAAISAVVVATVTATTATAAPRQDQQPRQDQRPGHEATRKAMDAVVAGGAPGVTARVTDADGVWKAAAGLGDIERGTPRGERDHYRVGSITKTFVATVVLQLEAEGKLDLDDTVGSWLPGVVEGNGHDGDRVTIRRLLNHSSGIYDVNADPEYARKIFSTDFLQHRYDTWTPAQMIAMAMRHAPHNQPGEGVLYSKTNYLLAGLIIEKATGRPYGDEIRRRVINPLRLRGTRVPGTSPTLPRPSSRAYDLLSGAPGGTLHDTTELNPSYAGAAGEMISNGADLNRFYTALLTGKLLPKRQLDAMKTTIPVHPDVPRIRFGLGLVSYRLSCGVTVWGHTGSAPGSSSVAVTSADGRHTLAANANGDRLTSTMALVDAEYCGT